MADKPKRAREPEIDSLGREAFIDLYLLSGRLTDEVEKLCRDEGITMSHYTVLWFLQYKGKPDGVPMRSVIDGHLNRASDSTRLADRLTDLGLIERKASADDRRVVLVRITKRGRDLFARLTARVQALHREQWKSLSMKELATLNDLLIKVLWGEGAVGGARHPLLH